ncbi:DUF4214 domain-containing protein [Stutzerimonas kunmingensis]|uniref:DUF4214 domain-containing protein n=1 Tax=Stutzerimonas kunmingensis TaxID=1211807 RepID=UPI0035B04BC5
MANVIASQVQELYVGYLGRAADQAGLDFWTNAITAGTSTIESVALGFTLSQEYTSKYEGLSSEELAAAIYENVLGRAADADGLAFWVGELEKGVQTPETLLAAMINSLGAVDQKVIDNKVYVANAYTAAAGADYKTEAGAKILEGVDGTAASVAKAIGTLPTSTATLTAALASLQDAYAAKSDFVNALDLSADGSTFKADGKLDTLAVAKGGNGLASADVIADVADNYTAKLSAFNNNANATGPDLTATSTTAQYDASIAVARANAAASVATAEKNAADLQKVIGTNSDLQQAVTVYNSAVATKTTADAAVVAKNAVLSGAEVSFESQVAAKANNAAGTAETAEATLGLTLSAGVPSAGDKVSVVITTDGAAAPAVDVITYNTTSKVFELASDAITETAWPGVTAYLTALNEAVAAEKAKVVATTAFNNAKTALESIDVTYNGANDPAVDDAVELAEDIATAATAITTATKASSDLETAITAMKAGADLVAELKALDDGITNTSKTGALDVITTAGYTVEVLDAGGEAATGKDDVFLFSDATQNTTITGFDVLGTDRIYIGTDFTLNNGEIATAGNDAVLELFIADDASGNAVISLETAVFGSNSSDAEIAITLTGVAAADLEFVNGYIQLA